jgi:GNAT superfamily N-acetyltransferase
MIPTHGSELPEVHKGYLPGAIGRLTELHGEYYARTWHFGLSFEAKVATELSQFMTRYDETRDCFWTVVRNGRTGGGIAIDAASAETEGAHLRWFILSEPLRGRGFGDMLLRMAVRFCRTKSYPRVYLWTFKGLQAARHLYEKHGFVLVDERLGSRWGNEVVEQRFELAIR